LTRLLLLDANRAHRVVPAWWQPATISEFDVVRNTASGYAFHGTKAGNIFVVSANQSEAEVQAMSAVRLNAVVTAAKAAGLLLVDTHDTKFLRLPHEAPAAARAPDMVVIGAGSGALDARCVTAVGDHKHPKDTWDADDVGKLLAYLIVILAWQPTRPFAVGILVGGRYAQAFKVKRDPSATQAGGFTAEKTDKIDMGIQAGSQLVAGFFLDTAASGFQLLGTPKTELLGVGGTGAVFADPDDDNVVVKVAYGGGSIQQERAILAQLHSCLGGDHNLLRIADTDDAGNDKELKLTPRFAPMDLPGRASRLSSGEYIGRLRGLIEPGGHLRLLHQQGFTHGDVRPPNIMQTPPEGGGGAAPGAAPVQVRLALVDFSAARRDGDPSPLTHTTVRYASKRVLHHIRGMKVGDPFQMLPADDVESLCRCIVSVGWPPPPTGDVDELEAHWEMANNDGVATIMDACRRVPLSYEAVIEAINASKLCLTRTQTTAGYS
jgi:hypothetical protein